MTLLRTIFSKHHHRLFNPKCIFSSSPSLYSFCSRHSHSSSATAVSPQLQQPPTDDSATPPDSWSIYGEVFDNHNIRTRFQHHSPNHISDREEEEEEEEEGDEEEDEQPKEEQEEVEVGESRYAIPKPSLRRGLKTTSNPLAAGEALPSSIVRPRRSSVKVKKQWVCSNCGFAAGQWWGICPTCELSGTMKEFHEAKSTDSDNKARSGLSVSEDAVGLWLPQHAADLRPIKLEEVNQGFNHLHWRLPLSGPFGIEVSMVLGGGLVPGSLTLVGGDPGVGKSTLLLQLAAELAKVCNDSKASPVLYVSGEESLEQIGNRAERLGIKSDIYLYSSTDIEDILKKAQLLSPRAVVVDSIQTVYLKGLLGSAGGILQVKECTAALMRFAKTTNIPVLLIGHVTKSGEIAGPRVLEHIVDVVLYMEGEKCSSYRMLRAVKNRFGSTDELGVFEMSQAGLQAVSNASEIFLCEQNTDSEFLAGLAITVLMDGSRTFLIEIQALCVSPCPTQTSSSPDQLVNGIKSKRANMIKCVLVKQAGLQLQDNAVFLNVISGWTITETAGDLAIAAAICSSFLEFPIPKGVTFIGEIGLGGELRMVPRIEKRVYTVAKLGYKLCVVPKQAEKVIETEGLGNMTVIGCKNLREVINAVFTTK